VLYNHEGSSDSVSSFESFVEDSLFSAKLSNKEGGTKEGAVGGQGNPKGKGGVGQRNKQKKV